MSTEGSTPASVGASVATNHDESFAEVPDNLWSKVLDSPSFAGLSAPNQENIFRQQYFEAARQYYESAMAVNAQGRAIAKLFLRWQDVAAQYTRFVLEGDADNPLDASLSWDPEGAGEAMVRPLRTDSFSNAQYSQTPNNTGQFNIIPDQTQGNGATETATGKEQAWMIFGWAELLGGNNVGYDYIQADINDNVGVRREEFTQWAMNGKQTLKVLERFRGPLLVEPGFTLDVDVNVVDANIQTGLWPIGFEVIRADAAEFGGVLG